MGIIFKSEKRRMIPKWRSIEIASTIGELNVSSKKVIPVQFNIDFLIEQRKAFSRNLDLLHAGDLLGSAYVLGLESEFKEVAKFIIEKETNQHDSLFKLAENVLGISEEKINNVDIGKSIDVDLKNQADIKKYRGYLKREPRNPIAWIELGRLYSSIGKNKKAKKCVDAALSLDKNNRFIVRSASRFYNHYESDNETALNIIKKSEFIKNDPWLLSAEIAYSSILERHSKMAKIGIDFMKNKKQGNYEVTELASAIATLEYNNGNVRDARKYFNESLVKPNDNSLAQIRWMADSIHGLEVDVSKYHVPFAFEANAIALLEKGNYKSSFENTLKWINDERYSTRPVNLASYISSIFLNDNERSISLIKKGLLINPNDIMLNNNLVYFLVRGDNVNEAKKIFYSKLSGQITDEMIPKLTVTATAGLLLYREGYRVEGKQMYERSIALAKRMGNEYLVALATVNYAKEELRFSKNKSELRNLIEWLEKYSKNNKTADINVLFKEVLRGYDKLED